MDRDYRGSGCAVGDGMPCFCCAQSIFAAGTAAAGQTGTEKADGEAGKPGRTAAGWKTGRYRRKLEEICAWKASRTGKPMTAGIQEGDFPFIGPIIKDWVKNVEVTEDEDGTCVGKMAMLSGWGRVPAAAYIIVTNDKEWG
nr:hypothetical protein [uncultured Acidaminococcus sp.]